MRVNLGVVDEAKNAQSASFIATLEIPSCMIVIPTIPGVRKSTYLRFRPVTSSLLRLTTGAVCVTANDSWSITEFRIAPPTAPCSARALFRYSVSVGTLLPGVAGAIRKLLGITSTRSRSPALSFASSASRSPVVRLNVSIFPSVAMKEALCAFFASSTTPRFTRTDPPKLSTPNSTMKRSGKRKPKNSAVRSRAYARSSMTVYPSICPTNPRAARGR